MAKKEHSRPTPSQIIETKTSLIHYYTSQQTSQSARLIGFTIALFTLLQVVQYSKQEPLSGIFRELARQISSVSSKLGISETVVMYTWIGEIVKFCVLFLSISFLMTWLIRTVFRFLVYAYHAQYVMFVGKDEIDSSLPIHYAIHEATFDRIKEIKAYWLFPLKWFMRKGKEKTLTRKGWKRSIVMAIISTLILLWLIW
jgi:hypothetical protein